MSRRMIVATVLVLAALGVGVGRSLVHDSDTAAPAVQVPVVSAAPSVLPAPSAPSVPAGSAAASGVASEPVDEGSGDGEPSTQVAGDAEPANDSSGDTATDRAHWEPVAVGFARAFTTVRHGDTNASWRGRLHPYVTTAVDKQLTTVDVRNVPAGAFDSLDVLETSDEQVSVQATYGPGWALVLYLISDGHDNWKVYGYDHLEQ